MKCEKNCVEELCAKSFPDSNFQNENCKTKKKVKKTDFKKGFTKISRNLHSLQEVYLGLISVWSESCRMPKNSEKKTNFNSSFSNFVLNKTM